MRRLVDQTTDNLIFQVPLFRLFPLSFVFYLNFAIWTNRGCEKAVLYQVIRTAKQKTAMSITAVLLNLRLIDHI
ncbi:hypothetical protein EAC26_03960 [Enterococcus faecium]|nr:hypothetical protein [Enterococcus faecium]EGP5303065.1 hypothetical protein [Enterococcus faecium]EGP5327830.1 hypothetical protein [Enterococcus faecium]EGP5430794.1 hypothetical protein [Enterococcus faecium]EGP5493012.1 hypothetical protein [Enterococcus faecium]